jgi:DNA-directed RNA polymerase subunit L
LNDKEGRVTTDDFQVSGGRKDVLMRDRDLDTPLYFLKMKKDDSVHITASLYVNSLSSHVCVSTYSYHVDPELAEVDKQTFIEENEGWDEAPSVFDNFYRQRSFHKNAKGMPDWFDFTVESIGLMPATELVKDALNILKKRILEWSKTEIVRENEENTYNIKSDSENHTLRGLIQAILYESGLCDFVTSDIPHPLRTEMIVRFNTTRTPEECVSFVKNKVAEYCDTCIGIL